MPAHPSLRASNAPRRNALSSPKKRRENHERETDDTKSQANRAAASRSSRRIEIIDDVNNRRCRENPERRDGPAALGLVHSHFAGPCPSISATNVLGSTRCAASCGHAYTQLGSFKCVQRSHDVAFCLIVAFFRPARSGSSTITSNGCKLIFPYGQFCAHSPHPMHQS